MALFPLIPDSTFHNNNLRVRKPFTIMKLLKLIRTNQSIVTQSPHLDPLKKCMAITIMMRRILIWMIQMKLREELSKKVVRWLKEALAWQSTEQVYNKMRMILKMK